MDLYRINLNLLIALDVLLEQKSVTAAAASLYITQAAMSNNLKQLRELFKDALLIREGNRMVLTSYARELQPRLHQVLEQVQCLVQTGQQFEPKVSSRTFTLAMSDYMAATILPLLMKKLQKEAPFIRFSIVSSAALRQAALFETGEMDLGIGKAHEIADALEVESLYGDRAVMMVSHRHPLAKKEKVTLTDYLSYQHISICPDQARTTPQIDLALEKIGKKRDVLVSMPFIIPVFKMVADSNLLIATVKKCMAVVFNYSKRCVIKKLPFKTDPLEFCLAWHPSQDQDAGNRWLREQIHAVAEVVAHQSDDVMV